VPSHVPQVPSQQSESWPQPAPSCPPDAPPQVPSHVPQLPLQHSESWLQLVPSCEPDALPHVPSHVPQLPLQQSESCPHPSPSWAHWLAHTLELGSQTSEPQHDALSVHASPVPRHPHVLLVGSQTFGEQQSLSLLQVSPDPRQPHVEVFGSQSRAPQQSSLPVQPSPLEAHPHVPLTQSCEQHSDAEPHDCPSLVHPPPPLPLSSPPSSPEDGATHVRLEESHRYAPQQSVELLAGSQSPPSPAHAG
jgi:hypothetical protein